MPINPLGSQFGKGGTGLSDGTLASAISELQEAVAALQASGGGGGGEVASQTVFHVSPTGSNANIGSVDSPIKDIQEAVGRATKGAPEPGGGVTTIYLAPGTYDEEVYVPAMFARGRSDNSPCSLVIAGYGSGAHIIRGNVPLSVVEPGATCWVTGLSLMGYTSSVVVANGGLLHLDAILGGPPSDSHIDVSSNGIVQLYGMLDVRGNTASVVRAKTGARVDVLVDTVITALGGAITVSEAFVSLSEGASFTVHPSAAFSDISVTGKTSALSGNSVLSRNGKTIPGTIAGTVATGGQYI